MAAHLEEQQELDNFKYFWKKTGRWIFALLIVAALGYLGYTIYQGQKASKDQEAAAVLAQMVEKAQQKTDQKAINADLAELQKNYPDSISTAQATLMVAATEFDAGRYDVAEGHLNWVLKNQKAPLVQALAAQRLGVEPSRCVALEDSPSGVRSATAAGMKVIVVPGELEVPAELGHARMLHTELTLDAVRALGE